MNAQHIALIERFCRYLARGYSDQDPRDLAQDVLIKLMDRADLPEAYVFTTCRNAWRDRLTARALRFTYSLDAAPYAAYLPQVEQEIEARQRGLSLDDWPEAKPRCTNGHEYTPQNTRLNAKGYRVCRVCAKASVRKRRLWLRLL